MVIRKVLVAAVTMLLVATACTSDEPSTVVGPTPGSAPERTAPPPSTTMPPETIVVTTTEAPPPPTTTTMLLAEVSPPEEAASGRVEVQADFVVSAPDQIDDSFTLSTLSEWLLPDRFRSITTLSFPGFTFGEVEVIEIGDEAWTKEHGKPWLPLTDAELQEALSFAADLELDEATRRANETELYGILSTLPWDVVRRKGTEARRYSIPVERLARALVLLGLSPSDDSAAEGTIDVFLRTSDDALIGYDVDVSGTPDLLDAPVGDYSAGTRVQVSLAAHYELGDDLGIVIDMPIVPEIDAPEGYLPYVSEGFGFEVLFPRPWFIFDEPFDYDGYVDVVTFFDLETNANLVVGVEDLRGFGGLTLDEYADITVDQYEFFIDDVEVVSRSVLVTADGRNAWVIHYRGASAGESIEGRQLLVFAGSDAYILTYTTGGDTPADRRHIDMIFGSAVFSGTKSASDG